jgi:asparagine synthetase B (glutamine-hydrolysing)
MGVKPLYYSIYNETFYFASTKKSPVYRWYTLKKIAQDLKNIFIALLLARTLLYKT